MGSLIETNARCGFGNLAAGRGQVSDIGVYGQADQRDQREYEEYENGPPHVLASLVPVSQPRGSWPLRLCQRRATALHPGGVLLGSNLLRQGLGRNVREHAPFMVAGETAVPRPRPSYRLIRPIALVGLMGCGKTTVGARLAAMLNAPFRDADAEIVKAAGRSIPDIFESLGEEAFRDGEKRVIARLLEAGPMVLATGGGAFMAAETRAAVKASGAAVWLRADLDTLVERTGRKNTRPLLRGGDPRVILQGLIDQRYPLYAEADIVVESTPKGSAEDVAYSIIDAIKEHDKGADAPLLAIS